MTIWSLIIATIAGVSLLALWTAYATVGVKLLRRSRVRDDQLFGVSILKPLKGVDEGLYENLVAIVEQNHPRFEVIFGAEDECDPALDVARRIVREFPERRIQVVSGSAARGLNPKVRVLRRLIQEATHGWILISDSNVRPDPDYLRALQARQIEEDADLVHSVLSGVGGKSWGGRLEELHLNGWVAASICLSDRLGHPCVIGKSMLMSRKALAMVGGFQAVEDILAEDYVTGARLAKLGRKVVLSPYRLPVITGQSPLLHFFNRHVRWGQMRRRIAPFFFLVELSANPTPFLLLLIAFGDAQIQKHALFAQAMKWGMDAVMYLRLSMAPSARTLALIPFKDLLVPVMWAISLFKRTVHWRGNRMLVGPGSRLLPLEEQPSELTGVVPQS